MGAVSIIPQALALAALGIAAGLWLLVRGMSGYRTATRIGDTGTSTISSLAAGEVRISGTIQPAELLLVSPLQSRSCVYYRSAIEHSGEGPDIEAAFREERSVGFRVADATGNIRVFPRGARWDAPVCFDENAGMLGEEPPGLEIRTGPTFEGGVLDRDLAVERLLTVQSAGPFSPASLLTGHRSTPARHYIERRLAPGDTVTIVGRAVPFSNLSDPTEADIGLDGDVGGDDPEVAADLAEARDAGLLAPDATSAWGNAGIAGFGIDRPVTAPALDPEARRAPLAPAGDAGKAERTFDIAPEALVLATTVDGPLLIVHGTPGAATEREQDRFFVGLLGAALAIGSAVVLAIMLTGGLGTGPGS